MIRRFLQDIRANYALATIIAALPIMGGLAFAIDYAEMQREKQAMMNALDAAGIATARQVVSGASDAELVAYANDFFTANLGPVNPADTTLDVTLPSTDNGGGTLELAAALNYHPHFYPVFAALLNNGNGTAIRVDAKTRVRLKNTLEVALVLDNSGSMNYYGGGSSQKRIDLLKTAANELVQTLADEADKIKQVNKPVQFGLVPFAASVNVGPQHAGAAWMDTSGISPVHHESFDWTTLDEPNKTAVKSGGVWRKSGSGWGAQEGEVLSRFSLYDDMREVASHDWVHDESGTEQCISWKGNGECKETDVGYFNDTLGPVAGWKGCVEARPYPYNVNDAPPDAGVAESGSIYGHPETLFVPMFGPDEPGDVWEVDGETLDSYGASNNWWNDGTDSGTGQVRLRNMAKYYDVRPYGVKTPYGAGPGYSCTTNPITPLTDVTTDAGMSTVNTAIDAMAARGNTDIPEGMAWGWRVVSSAVPFTQGRPDGKPGNDKVVIVLTDGANTYSRPRNDPAGSRSTYAAYGYLQPGYGTTGIGRLFLGTGSGVGKYDYSRSNYTEALNDHMMTLCGNAKAADIIVMTVALDLVASDYSEGQAIDALRTCASDSRFRKDPGDPSRPAKLFWNATGADLSETFEDIARELSNLRVVG